MVKHRIPDRGDIVLIQFHPNVGHEQAGKRPALVLSRRFYNAKSGIVILCPITSKSKGYPFEVPLPIGTKTKGVVLCDQIKSFDWNGRQGKYLERAIPTVLQQVAAKLDVLLP